MLIFDEARREDGDAHSVSALIQGFEPFRKMWGDPVSENTVP
jgi:hypothetical protein